MVSGVCVAGSSPGRGGCGQGPRSPSPLGGGHAAASWEAVDRVMITEQQMCCPFNNNSKTIRIISFRAHSVEQKIILGRSTLYV